MYTQLSYFWKTFPKVSSIFFKPPSDNHFHDLWTILFSHFYLWPVVVNEGSADFRTMMLHVDLCVYWYLMVAE